MSARFSVLVFFLVFFSATLDAQGRQGVERYLLGAGDVISINVYGEPDLSFQRVRLTDAGTFSYPFFKELSANGKTPAQVERYLVQLLEGDYLIEPRISVSIVEYRDFYMNGEVRSPGGYPFKPGLTLRKAIALAGGYTPRAAKTKIHVVRKVDGVRKKLRFKSVDAQVMPGDIITVEQSFF